MDGTSRLALVDGTPLQHGLMIACFAERTVVAGGGAVPLPRGLPLWQMLPRRTPAEHDHPRHGRAYGAETRQ
jgi:hypothetical protein